MTGNPGWFYPDRGDILIIDLGFGRHHYVVVSRDGRNKGGVNDFLVVGATTVDLSRFVGTAPVVPVGPADRPLRGFIKCDDVQVVFKDDDITKVGVVSARTMLQINQGLRQALSL